MTDTPSISKVKKSIAERLSTTSMRIDEKGKELIPEEIALIFIGKVSLWKICHASQVEIKPTTTEGEK